MLSHRAVVRAAAGLIASLLVATPVAARSRNRALIDDLHATLLAVALVLTVAVFVAFGYAVLAFRDADVPSSTPDAPALEVAWTVGVAVALLFVGVSGYSVLASPYVSPAQPAPSPAAGGEYESLPDTDDEEVRVVASQWNWTATYPGANATTRNAIVLPAGENVTIWVTSDDVVHSLFVADLGLAQDAVPGRYTRVRTVVHEPGAYDLRCAEYCGSGHANMSAAVVVLETDRYEAWLEANADERNATVPSSAALEE